jgi:hypothetical protein
VRQPRIRNRFRSIAAVAAAVLTTIAVAIPASAHTPVQLDSGDVLPWRGPLILDGENPVMLFGTLPHAGAVRSGQLKMTAGQHLIVNLAIPNEAPENALPTTKLPEVFVVSPKGSVVEIKATMRVPIQTEGGQNLLLLGNYTGTAIAGDYSIIVTGCAAERFATASGIEGDDAFAGVQRGRVATDDEVATWYATPPA